MPTLIVENVPPDIHERLQQRAAAQQRTLPEETLYLLQQVLRTEDRPTSRLPEFIPSKEVAPLTTCRGRVNPCSSSLTAASRACRTPHRMESQNKRACCT